MYTMPSCVHRLGVRSLLSAVAVASVLRGASEHVAQRPIPLPTTQAGALPMGEIQFAFAPKAIATTRAPALPGQPVPSRWSQSDRPIGWEAMGAAELRAAERARGATDPRAERAASPFAPPSPFASPFAASELALADPPR